MSAVTMIAANAALNLGAAALTVIAYLGTVIYALA